MSTTSTGFVAEPTIAGKTGARRERQIYNRTKYRLNKRRNLWLRSIASAKDPKKIATLQAKVEAFDLALAILEEA